MKLLQLFIKAATPIASIAFALAGIIQLRAQFWTAGAIFIGLAVIGFMLSMRLLEKTPFTPQELETLRPFAVPAIAWIVAINLMTISVVYVADNFKSAETDRIAELAWIGSVILSLIITWRKRPTEKEDETFTQKLKTNRTELMLLFLVIAVAFALRTINLTTHPYPWSGDEASIGIEARRILNGDITNYFETGWSSQPNWSFVPTAITEKIFGVNILAIRMTSVIAGVLAVFFIYLTARELFNPSVALMAGAILATLPYNVHFSRIGVNNVIDSFMSALMFWLITRGIKKDDPRLFFNAGIVAGLSIYTYAGTRLVLIIGCITLLFLILRQRSFLSNHWKSIVAFAVAVVVSAAPQAAFFARHQDIFLGRFGQEGILLNGWLTQQAAQTGKSVFEILFNQFTRTTLVFIASPAPGNLFNSPEPYLTVTGSILFILGMGYTLAYIFEPKNFILLLWFWSVILFGGILTLNPPANTRLLMTTPAVALFIALGASKIFEYMQKFGILPDKLVASMLAIVIGIISYQNISFYMGEYKSKMYFQDANGEYAMEAGLMAKELGDDYQIYSLGAPRIFSGFPTIVFIAPNNLRADVTAESLPTLELAPDQKAVFFAIPENRPLITELSNKYPGGEQGLVYRKTKPDDILFEYYILNQ